MNLCRQKYLKSSAPAGLALNRNKSVMAFYDTERGGKPEAGTFADLFGGKEGIENFINVRFSHPGAGITDSKDDVRPYFRILPDRGVILLHIEILSADC